MNSLLLFASLFSSTTIFGQASNSYIIHGTTDVKEGYALLDAYSKTPDSVKIVDGKFEFKGNINSPRYQTVLVRPGTPHRIILEPGNITVNFNSKEGYNIGGTENNKRLNEMDWAIKPYNDKVAELWKLYNKSTGETRASLFKECEKARMEKNAKARELILSDPNYSGFLMMLPYYRDETATTVKKYLEHFTTFKNDDGYKRLNEYYKGASNTDFGKKAPDWIRPDDKGNLLKLSSLRGKYVLVDFWYAGCVWCRRTTPHLTKVYNELKNKGLEIVSVSIDTKENEAKWRQAMEEDKAPWLQAWDYDKKLPDEYGVLAYPTMFLLDKEGRVVEKIIGYREEPALRDLFAKYIK